MSITHPLHKLNQYLGYFAASLIFFMMLFTVTTVVLRYGFGIASIALQEAATYCHASAFLLAAAFTLQAEEHVRVDIFYSRMSAKQQAWVNSLGVIFLLLPFCLFLLFSGWHYFIAAWQIKESSAEAGGLAFVYLFKGLIPLSMLMLSIEAMLLFVQSAKVLVLPHTTHTKSV